LPGKTDLFFATPGEPNCFAEAPIVMRTRFSADFAIGTFAVTLTAVLFSLALLSRHADRQESVQVVDASEQSTEQLLASARTEPVCREILKRQAVNRESLVAALIRLARLTGETKSRQLSLLISELDNDLVVAQVSNLSSLASLTSGDDRLQLLKSVRHLSTSPQSTGIRQAAMVTWLTMVEDRDTVFQAAAGKGLLGDLLTSLPLVSPGSLHHQLYDQVKPILLRGKFVQEHREQISHDSGFDGKPKTEALDPDQAGVELQKVAISVCTRLIGREAEKARDLIALLPCRELRPAVIESLIQLPANAISKQHSGFLAAELVAFIAEQPLELQTSGAAQRALDFGWRISEMLTDEKKDRLQKRLAELSSR